MRAIKSNRRRIRTNRAEFLRLGVPLLVVAGLLLPYLSSCRQAESLGANEVDNQVNQPRMIRKVVALGRLEPWGEIVNLTAPPGDRVARLEVTRGEEVKAGQVLVYLESQEERLAARNQALSRLRDAEAVWKSETSLGQALVAESEIRLQRLEEEGPLQIRAQEAEVKDLEAQLALAVQDEQRLAKLKAKGVASQQAIDHQMTEVERLRSGLDSARAELTRLVKSFENDRDLAFAQLSTARAMLLRNQEALRLPTLKAELEYAEIQLEKASIESPLSGRVLDILTHPGEATGLKPIMQLGDINQLYAVAEVYETEVRFVRVGQAARITSRALSTEIAGRVEEIGSIVTGNDVLDIDPTAEIDRRVVEVWIRLNHEEEASGLINLQVDVEIDCREESARR